MPSSLRLGLLKIPVKNVAESAAFYRDVFDFQEEFVAEEYGWAQLSAGEIPLALYQPGMGGGTATIGGSTGFHLLLDAAEFDPLATALQNRGVLVDDRIHQGNDGTVFIDVRDPDGNVLKIFRA